MSRPVKLYPGSDPAIFSMPFWCDIQEDSNSTELWIDFHHFWSYSTLYYKSDLKNYIPPVINKKLVKPCRNIVFYDWFHGQQYLRDDQIEWIQGVAKKRPVTWITLNPKSVYGVNTIKFDYYWNRSKRAFLERLPFHKVNIAENYVQYPVHTDTRPKKFLTYQSRTEEFRKIIRDHLINNYDGFYNDPDSAQWLLPNVYNIETYSVNSVSPPGRFYYDNSYVTCLVETQHLGSKSHLVSEKTYDNLLQGRAVLNFATPGFYHYLLESGWRLPTDIDWSWDLIIDDRKRLDAYLVEVDRLLGRSQQDLHEWFVSNMKCWKHNQKMLWKMT